MIVAESGLEWLRVYWLSGTTPNYAKHKNAVNSPPCTGWQHAFVLPGDKRSTIFCPYSFEAFTVRNDCMEVATAREPDNFPEEFVCEMIERKWHEMQARGWQRDYDTCALVLRRLGREVPAQVMVGGEEDDRKKGGKEVGSELLKPVKASSKRGRFLRWFLDEDGARSVREAMAEFSMTRSNVLSYLYMLQKDHGIGYELVGDTATIQLPDGCVDPFNVTCSSTMVSDTEAVITVHGDKFVDPLGDDLTWLEEADDDDSWLD